MKQNNRLLVLVSTGFGMLCLILDSRCAAESAASALNLCLKTVIPSLFPMFVLSALLTGELMGRQNRMINAMESLLRLPSGGGSIFLLGAVGGFPVGAQCLTQAVEQHTLSAGDAARMMGFCNNCSLAFLFGMLPSVLPSPAAPVLVFLIQLETAMIAAQIWSQETTAAASVSAAHLSISDAVTRGIRSMVSVCAWVILACVVNGFLQRWVYPMFSEPVPTIAGGLLEITGGILSLTNIKQVSLRFILCCGFVGFGGISVLLQIQSVAAPAGISARICVWQKVFQSILALAMAAGVVWIHPTILLIPPIILIFRKKKWKFQERPCIIASVREVSSHVVPKKDPALLSLLHAQHPSGR